MNSPQKFAVALLLCLTALGGLLASAECNTSCSLAHAKLSGAMLHHHGHLPSAAAEIYSQPCGRFAVTAQYSLVLRDSADAPAVADGFTLQTLWTPGLRALLVAVPQPRGVSGDPPLSLRI